ncbi:hypothetical protein MNBD_GAMMA03-674 [hydrothermal vent metagenome]|uniref:Uncharacterized protein n=1 Tax=hydrothermal vent metagenome TaxID=652676 RepID=A0A3B0WLW5_9ZZZZ
MNNKKTYPTHAITFSEKNVDHQNKMTMGQPLNVGAVWARKNGKQGGMLNWNISPAMLGDGEYRLVANRFNEQSNIPKTYRISFSEKRDDLANGSQLGRPVDVATVQESGIVNWTISPQRLNNGVFFVLENERKNQRSDKSADAISQIETSDKEQSNGLMR